MRVLETLAEYQARSHAVAVLSPEVPRVSRSVSLHWEPVDVPGNTHLIAVAHLVCAVRRWRPHVAVHHAGTPGELALPVAWLSAFMAPVIVVEHLPELSSSRATLRGRAFAWLNRRAARWVSVSSAGARSLEGGWRLPPGTLGVVHAGVEEPPCPEGGADDSRPVVLALGRPEPRKGFETFVSTAIALAETHSEVRWLWIGAGSPGRTGPVELLPWVPEAGAWLRSATLLLVPSTAEGIPLVVMEALACGCPVVASRVGGIPEAIEDGVNGVLLEPEDTAGWVRTVDALLRDPYRRAALGAAGRAAWEAHWTAEAMVSRFEALLAEVVEARR